VSFYKRKRKEEENEFEHGTPHASRPRAEVQRSFSSILSYTTRTDRAWWQRRGEPKLKGTDQTTRARLLLRLLNLTTDKVSRSTLENYRMNHRLGHWERERPLEYWPLIEIRTTKYAPARGRGNHSSIGLQWARVPSERSSAEEIIETGHPRSSSCD